MEKKPSYKTIVLLVKSLSTGSTFYILLDFRSVTNGIVVSTINNVLLLLPPLFKKYEYFLK